MKTEAFWNGQRIAASDSCVKVEGTAYFPAADIAMQFLTPSSHTSVCGWKGTAGYFNIVVGDQTNANAAWTYREPKVAAAAISGHVAFWKGVEVKGAEHAVPMDQPDGAVC